MFTEDIYISFLTYIYTQLCNTGVLNSNDSDRHVIDVLLTQICDASLITQMFGKITKEEITDITCTCESMLNSELKLLDC